MAYCKNCGSEAGPKRNQHVKLRKYTCRRNPSSSYSEGYDFAALIPDVTDYTDYTDYSSNDSNWSNDNSYSPPANDSYSDNSYDSGSWD